MAEYTVRAKSDARTGGTISYPRSTSPFTAASAKVGSPPIAVDSRTIKDGPPSSSRPEELHLRALPEPCVAGGVTMHRFSRSIRKPGRASRRLHAGCRSGRIRASPELILEEGSPPVLTSPNPLSTLLQRFACARLSRPCLPKSSPGVSATLTTTAFVRSSLWWLEIGS